MEFYIVTDCAERGLYRKHKKVKQLCQKNLEAKYVRFQSPTDIPAAQEFCTANGISISQQTWDDLLTAGRLSLYALNGTLPPAPGPGAPDAQQDSTKKTAGLPPDAAAVIYTDGSCFYETGQAQALGKQPTLGGWAGAIILRDYYDAMVMVSGRTTRGPSREIDSYYMELLAVDKALKRLKKYEIHGKTVLYTDCLAVVTDFNEKLAGWAECGFQKANGKYIKYHKLWQKIWIRIQDLELKIYWIKGHAKNPYNELCHVSAQAEALLRKLRKDPAQLPAADLAAI